MTRIDLTDVVAFDTDGALQETAERAERHSRRGFLKGTGLALGGALAAGAGLPALAGAASKGDVAILNFALTLAGERQRPPRWSGAAAGSRPKRGCRA